MVKLLFSVPMASVAGDDYTALLQQPQAFDQSLDLSTNRQFAAASGKDTICVKAAAGDVAPITGSFTGKMSHQAVEVAAGSVAKEDGNFCVPRQDVMFLQRTLGSATAQDLEAAFGTKGGPHDCAGYTCTTRNWVKQNGVEHKTEPTDRRCCEPTCGGYNCTLNLVKQIGVDTKTEPTDQRCCEPTCGGYNCTTLHWVKQIGVDNKMTKPTDQRCCEPSCAGHTCSKRNWVKQIGSDDKTKPTDESCCVPTCATVVCPRGQVTKFPWSVLVSESDCCESSQYTVLQFIGTVSVQGYKLPHTSSMPTNQTFGQCAESCFNNASCFNFGYSKVDGVPACLGYPREAGGLYYREIGEIGGAVYTPLLSCPSEACSSMPDSVCKSTDKPFDMFDYVSRLSSNAGFQDWSACSRTCATYSCPKDSFKIADNLNETVGNMVRTYTRRRYGRPQHSYLVDPSLDLKNCCLEKKCSNFPCPRDHKRINTWSFNFSQSNCCLAPQATCQSFSCPEHYKLRSSNQWTTELNQSNCCEATCDSFTCPSGLVRQAGLVSIVPSEYNCCQLDPCTGNNIKFIHQSKVMPGNSLNTVTLSYKACTAACRMDLRCVAFSHWRWVGPTTGGYNESPMTQCVLKSAWNGGAQPSDSWSTTQVRGCRCPDGSHTSNVGTNGSSLPDGQARHTCHGR